MAYSHAQARELLERLCRRMDASAATRWATRGLPLVLAVAPLACGGPSKHAQDPAEIDAIFETETDCGDNVDNDKNGVADCDDPQCGESSPLCAGGMYAAP